jgi:3-dehydroquinate synthase
MPKQAVRIGNSVTDFYWNSSVNKLSTLVNPAFTVLITDKNVYQKHVKLFKGWNVIVIKPGEKYKVQDTVQSIIEQLIAIKADRSFTLVGVGGGVVTDLTGYVASIYMRGIRFGFVPTSLLAMVDASIGGKNGIDVGSYKNMMGIIRQPQFILHDLRFLQTLPASEWKNGFAEIIKHACIKDRVLFKQLLQRRLHDYQQSVSLLAALVKRNALIKLKLVKKDELERGDRKLLNFGHTLGHALENFYALSHGQAIAIGMTYAALFSKVMLGFSENEKLVQVLQQYGLPTYARYDAKKIFQLMEMDKKRNRAAIQYVFLQKIGIGVVKSIPLATLKKLIHLKS